MSYTPYQISNATPTLKKVIVGTVKDNLKTNALAWYLAGGSMPQDRKDAPYQEPKRLNSSVIDMTNNTATIPVRLGRHAGIYGVTESDNNLPTPAGPGISAATVSAKYITGTFRITLQSMQVREGSGAVVSLMKENVRSLSIDYIHDLNRQFFGNGAGAIARVASNTAGNSTTLALSKPNFAGATSSNGDIDFADYFPVNSVVLVGSTTAKVTAVAANSLTVSPGILTAADTVSKANEGGTASAELDGLALMVKGSGTAYLSLTAGGWAAARETSQAAATNTMTESMIDTAYIAAAKTGKPDAILLNQTLWRKYASLLATYKKSATGREVYYGGTVGIEYAGGNAAVLLDYDTPDDAAYILSTEDLQLLQWKDFDLEDGTDGKALRVPGTLNYEIVGSWFGNIATSVRSSHAVTQNMVG